MFSMDMKVMYWSVATRRGPPAMGRPSPILLKPIGLKQADQVRRRGALRMRDGDAVTDLEGRREFNSKQSRHRPD